MKSLTGGVKPEQAATINQSVIYCSRFLGGLNVMEKVC